MAADSECWDGTGTNKNNCLLKDNVQLLTISQADCLKNDLLENMKDSFFLGGKRSDLCRCFGSNSVVSLDVHALDVHCDQKSAENVKFSQICEENEENCRKKRCTDRYDSSESSDSGVAALSSSSTSDITDPGSPFSTASTHSSNSESGDEKPPSYQSAYPSTPSTPSTSSTPYTPVKTLKTRASHWAQQKEACQTDAENASTTRVGSSLQALQDCRLETSNYIDLLETTPCFISKARASKADHTDGRNFISLGNADALLRISQPSVSTAKTRNVVWNLTAPKATRSFTTSSEELPMLPDGSLDDDRLIAPNLPSDDAETRAGPSDGETGVPTASKISPVPKTLVPTSIQTRRNSATQGLNNLSNSYKNTGSSLATVSEVCKKGKPGSNSAILSSNATHRWSSDEVSKLSASVVVQTRGKSCSTVSRNLLVRLIDSKPSPGAEESGPPDTSTKTPSPVWNCTKESSDLVPNTCEIPSLATIALTVPTYCILSSKVPQSRGNKVSGECFQSPVQPAPRSFHWTPGASCVQTLSKSTSVASYLVAGNHLVTQGKCILVAAPKASVSTGPNGSVTIAKASGNVFSSLCSSQGSANPAQLRFLSKTSMVPDAPAARPSEEVSLDSSLERTDITLQPTATVTGTSLSGKASPKKNVIAKPIPSAKVPNKRFKYQLTQTKLIQETKVNHTNRNIYVTRQQTQRCCVNLPMLPNHIHNTRKCSITEETETILTKTPHQGKITEYFKTQRKSVSNAKKDSPKDAGGLNSKTKKTTLAGVADDEDTGFDKYVSLISPPSSKMTKKVHTAANKNVSITSPVQVFLLNKLESDSRVAKILNNFKPQNGLTTSPRKILASSAKVPERSNGIHPPTKPTFLMPATHKPLKKCSLSPKQGALSPKSGQQCKLTSTSSNMCLNLEVPLFSALSCSGSETSDSTDCCSKSIEMDSPQCDLEKEIDIVMECSNLVVQESCSLDSESGISSSLSVIVSSSCASSFPMVSPILSAPKTIRFPATQRKSLLSSQHDSDEKTQCRWAECSEAFHSSTGLMEHLQTKHVIPQTSGEHYVCLWVGCKVFSRKSCSQSWLERHALSHGGNKPFRCIVDGCGQRFGSNTALERHVNGHFDQEAAGSNAQGPRRSLDGVSGKMMRRNGKKLRYRKQPWSARMFDYFDSGIMEGLQHRLVGMTQARTSGFDSTPGDTIVLTSKVMARRIAPDGTTRYLLKWFPAGVLDDEWVAQSQVVSTRSVPIPSLPPSACAPLHSALLVTKEPLRNKHRRKPPPRPT